MKAEESKFNTNIVLQNFSNFFNMKLQAIKQNMEMSTTSDMGSRFDHLFLMQRMNCKVQGGTGIWEWSHSYCTKGD